MKELNVALRTFQGPRGPKGDAGERGERGAQGERGERGAEGTRWHTGAGVYGKPDEPTVFPYSGVVSAAAGDLYLNTGDGEDVGSVYRCETAGAPDAAAWRFACSVRGAGGPARPSIRCWGDGMTAGDYPRELAALSGCAVMNLGAEGEDMATIAARQGADPLTAPDFTIPADCTPAVLGACADGLYTLMGGTAQPMINGGAGVNPCRIDGIEGLLTVENRAGEAQYCFTRLSPGDAWDVFDGTIIETYAMRHASGGVAVFFMDGGGDVQAYIDQVQTMAESGRYGDYLAVVCREFTDEADIAALRAAFGPRFLHLLPLLAACGMEEAGVAGEAAELVNGLPAPLCAADGVHLSPAGERAAANFIYKRLVENGAIA